MPTSVAAVLEALELDQPRIVTTVDIEQLRRDTGTPSSTRYLLTVLTEKGWLLPLRSQGVWEFAPAARAGAFSVGDPHIEIRAALRKRPNLPIAIAEESAAFLHGLAGRVPTRQVISAPAGLRLPPALNDYRIVRIAPHLAPVDHAGLPIWSIHTLLTLMAHRPGSYRDWPNVTDWLTTAVARTTEADLRAELTGRPRSTWMRLAYLLERGGAATLAERLTTDAPNGHGPYYLGPRNAGGHHNPSYDVVDSVLIEVGG